MPQTGSRTLDVGAMTVMAVAGMIMGRRSSADSAAVLRIDRRV